MNPAASGLLNITIREGPSGFFNLCKFMMQVSVEIPDLAAGYQSTQYLAVPTACYYGL